jgi:hypothetical protein
MKRFCIGLLALLIYLPAVTTVFHAELLVAPKYTFTLNGKSISPPVWSLHGTPHQPQSGDLVRIGNLLVTLGPQTHYDFRSTPDDDGRLLLRTETGREIVAGAVIRSMLQGDRFVSINPLAKMTDRELHSLRGVLIEQWNDGVAAKLGRVDPERTCITITGETGQELGGVLPPLPAGLFYLYLDAWSGNRISDLGRLKDQTKLRLLVIEGLCGQVDADVLKRAVKLAYLDLSGNQIHHPEALQNLTGLRHLDLAYCEGIDSIGFASSLPLLVELGMQGTMVGDLSPLSKLGSLTSVVANRTRAKKLPSGPMPALRRLEVMSTWLDDGDVAAFIAAHPRCGVRFHWDQVLRDALVGTTRLRIRADGMCNSATDKTLVEVLDSAQIKGLLDLICIDEATHEFYCECCGAPIFEFYRHDKLVVSLGFHHGSSLSWGGVWPGHGRLIEASSDAVCIWLAAHGAKGALEERAAIKQAGRASRHVAVSDR